MFQARNIYKKYPNFTREGYNWIEKLRERCRKRIKEERDQRFNSPRNLPSKQELQSFVVETVQGEWRELKASTECLASSSSEGQDPEIDEDQILKEIQEELLLQEESKYQEYLALYQLTEDEYEEYLKTLQDDYVICPLCCRNDLTMTCNSDGSNQISCSGDCMFLKNVSYGLDEVRKRIDRAVEEHSKCPNLPGFTFTCTEDDSELYLVCSECEALSHVL